MKLFRMLGRNIRDAFRSVIRNFSLSIASITCITITLVIVALSVILSMNVNNFTKIIKEDVTMVVYVQKETPSEYLEGIEQSLRSNSNVATVLKKDKEQVKEDMMKSDDFLNTLMGEWTESENPLRDTFQVTVKDLEKIKQTIKQIEEIDHVDFVDYGEKIVESMVSLFKTIEKVSVVVVLSLVVVTIFLIINTIKLTIFSRKREISIMRLVGASNLSIKIPFVIEGMILGIMGSIIPIILTIYGYFGLYKHFNGQLFSPLIKLITPEPFVYMVALIVLGLGIVVGMLGSLSAVRKYLKI